MTKYLLFSSEDYDGIGGANDCRGIFDSLDDATAAITDNADTTYWAHVAVIDGDRLRIVTGWLNNGLEWRETD